VQYRDYGNTGIKVSALGFGVAKLPMAGDGADARVNDELAIPIIRAAYDGGINYYDSAWNYLNNDSQRILGLALNSVRDKVYYATKLPCWLVKERDDFWRYLMATLENMDTNYIDFYHFHGLDAETFARLKTLKIINSAERALANGYIRHLSFSFHDSPEVMRGFIDTGLFESLLCQYNMIDRKNEGPMAYAAEKGMGVAVMGPTGGGILARGGPDFVKRMGSGAASAAEMAFRFVWGNPAVSTALSGMDSVGQVMENLRYAENSGAVGVSEIEKMDASAGELNKFNDIYCSNCEYCRDCPKGIKIGTVFRMYINHKVWGLSAEAKNAYAGLGEGSWNGNHPEACTDCGACTERCPQKLDVPAELRRVSAVLKNL
jgi:predicted aldo/keto reductase-like oxidoreductase